ncbi:IclR family transcriptional regulator [Microbacterium sp. BWT-B31]|uniref:IclR family transcriptional regulator n=1 Tax=Microbacterium sp. BWT-B31 TaxID=3232072 RepID=UPI00352950AD
MSADRDSAGMAILEKSGSVIAALERLGEASVVELAGDVDEPVSSTYRLLGALTDIGWVDRGTRRGTFRLGVKLVRVGSLLEDQLSVRDASKPGLRRLRSATGATAFLCFARGDAAVCVERLDGRDVHSLAMRLGDSLPLYRGAAPLAIFSHLPESERDAVLERFAQRRESGEDIPSEAALRRRLTAIRKAGYSVSDEDVTPGIAAVGAPVFNHRGELEGAISVSGLRGQILSSELDVPALVLGAAQDASRALGCESLTQARS